MDAKKAWYRIIKPGSARVDWCEPNYLFYSGIAEFYNTTSNILLVTLPVCLILLSSNWHFKIHQDICKAAFLLEIVGLSSIYFHATLSLLGQMLDELSILWTLAVSVQLFYPSHRLPGFLKKDRKAFQSIVNVFSLIASTLSCFYPWTNALCLLWSAVPILYVMYVELKLSKNLKVRRLAQRALIFWVLSFSSWVCDRKFCDFWLSINFTYLHSTWHLFAAITAIDVIVAFAFIRASADFTEQRLILKYWPDDKHLLGVPYLAEEKKVN